jgi:hypothetical protein
MTPDPEARRRALERIIVQSVGAPLQAPRAPVDLAALAPAPEMDAEGTATDTVHGFQAPPSTEEERLRQRTALGNLAANMAMSSSRAIETLTGAPGSGVHERMRAEAEEPLKTFLRAQELKQQGATRGAAAAKPAMSDEQARANLKALYPNAPDGLIAAVTAGNYEATRKSLEGGAGRTERSGALTRREEAEKARLEQQRSEGKLNRSVQWARIQQDAEQFGSSMEFKRWVEEQKAKAEAAEAAAKGAGQTVPAGEAASIGQSRAALAAIGVLGQQFVSKGAAGKGARVLAAMPWDTDPAKYEDDVLAAAQAVGTILEGGKLAAGDEIKYRKLFPKAGDSLERAQNKLDNVRRLVGELTDAKVEALGSAGYNVSGFKAGQPKRMPAAAALPKDASGQPTLEAPARDKVRIILNGQPKRVPNANLEALKKMASEKGWTLEIPNG